MCLCECVIGTFIFDHINISKAKVLDSIQIYSFISAGPQLSTGL